MRAGTPFVLLLSGALALLQPQICSRLGGPRMSLVRPLDGDDSRLSALGALGGGTVDGVPVRAEGAGEAQGRDTWAAAVERLALLRAMRSPAVEDCVLETPIVSSGAIVLLRHGESEASPPAAP